MVRLCLVRRDGSNGYAFEVRHTPTGRRHAEDGTTAAASALNRTIRSVIRAIGWGVQTEPDLRTRPHPGSLLGLSVERTS